jgi:hypothetical protein
MKDLMAVDVMVAGMTVVATAAIVPAAFLAVCFGIDPHSAGVLNRQPFHGCRCMEGEIA